MQIFAPAKLNLALDILKKTASGYHEIQTVYFEYKKLSDEIEIFETQDKDSLSMTERHQFAYSQIFPKEEENLALKTLQLVKSEFQINRFAQIHITKNIPLSSGLGGASSDAAAILKGLNELWNLNLSPEKLAELGARLGMDVPFFIYGGTCLGTHFGEKITPLKLIQNIEFELLPEQKWSALKSKNFPKYKTQEMYDSLNLALCGQNLAQTKKLLEGIETENSKLILENLHNDFGQLYEMPVTTHLSGSGPALFFCCFK